MVSSVMVASLVFLAGCDDDDSSSSGSVVGTWNADKVVMTSLEGTTTERKMGDNWSETVTFNSDGSWSYSYTYNGENASGTGYYTDDGTALLINGTDNMPYDVDGNTMSWSGSVANGAYKIVWKRQ